MKVARRLMKMFSQNIEPRGRAIRAVVGAIFAIACVATWPHSRVAAAVFGLTAAFMFFEAARGWCAARACGIKTPF